MICLLGHVPCYGGIKQIHIKIVLRAINTLILFLLYGNIKYKVKYLSAADLDIADFFAA